MLIDSNAFCHDKVTYCPITLSSQAELAEFYERMCPERGQFLSTHWRWLYRSNKSLLHQAPLLAFERNKIIAHLSSTPVTLRRGADLRQARWIQDLFVAPEYRRRGVASNLTQIMTEQFPLHIAFGNENSVTAFLKLGWRLSNCAQSFQLLLKPEAHSMLKRFTLTPLGKAAGVVTRGIWRARTISASEPAIEEASQSGIEMFSLPIDGSELHVQRSREFWTWRIFEHPLREEHFIFCLHFSPSIEYRLLVRLSENTGYRQLHLLSLSASPFNEHYLSHLFASAVKWSIKAGIHRILFVTSNPMIAKAAHSWFPINEKLNFLYHAKDKSDWEYLESPAYHWECLDSDLDLITHSKILR